MTELKVTPDLDVAIQEALEIPIHPDSIVLFTEHPEFPGCLMVDLAYEGMRQDFFDRFSKWISRHLTLNELFQLETFCAELEREGFYPIFDSSCLEALTDHRRWSRELTIPGYHLFDYQNFSLNKALERHREGSSSDHRQYFWNWSAGAGKSYCSGAGVKALFGQEDIDLVIACTLSKLKINLSRFLQGAGIDVVVNDGTPEKRQRVYGENHQAYVMNFEKLRVDLDEITNLVRGKRVLFILDEAHKLISDGGPNQSRVALDALCRLCEATVWPMSATVVGGNPLRFRDVFSLGETGRHNPLGTKKDFMATYARSVKTVPAKTRNGGTFMFTKYDWDLSRLTDVRHRVHDRTMAVRRPSNMPTIPLWIQANDKTRDLSQLITDYAWQAKERGETLMPYYRLLRQVAVIPAALEMSDDPIAVEIANDPFCRDQMLTLSPSAKVTVLNDMLEEFQQAQDQVVAFIHWTTLGLHLIAPHVNVPHVTHYGTGQSNSVSQKAQDDFKANPDITLFLSSDAGAHGLNFQNARYVINIDPVYDYDVLTQRNKRIDRADSYLEGLTSYVMITEDSVEERVFKVCDLRRRLAAATQGTVEELTPEEIELAEAPEELNLEWMIFES